ncbi:DedA family protein [Yoonia sediminilitoris]|uniref:DedA family protein n=1 Tax=Yoonia sediminilitoris TaxID=1286148 RepID=UPI001455A215|nr:DedA family protein [Yoonia sediminilitoris]
MNSLLPSLEAFGLWGYWVVGLLVFGEALVLTSVFAPGTAVVILAGALTAKGVYDFGDMVWFVAIGTILGSEASFRIGSGAENLFSASRRVLSASNLARGQRFLERFGGVTIVVAHFLGPLRPIMPVVAGMSGMDRHRFWLWNLIGGSTYAVSLLGVGYFFGTALGFATSP